MCCISILTTVIVHVGANKFLIMVSDDKIVSNPVAFPVIGTLMTVLTQNRQHSLSTIASLAEQKGIDILFRLIHVSPSFIFNS